MKISSMMPSNYLKKEDVATPRLVTVRNFSQQNLAQDGQPPENKWVMHLDEFDRPLVMNPTNLQLAAQAFGSEDTDDWVGKQIVLYTDSTVSFGGKLVGGLRLRAPKRQAPLERLVERPASSYSRAPVDPVPRGDLPPMSGMDDDIPFN